MPPRGGGVSLGSAPATAPLASAGMRTRPKMLLPLSLCLSIAVAGAQTSTAEPDTIFAPEQVWKVTWSSGDVSLLTVPELSWDGLDTFEYDDWKLKAPEMRTTFLHYLQTAKRIEHLEINLFSNDTLYGDSCIYTRPVPLKIGESVAGFEVIKEFKWEEIKEYVRTGDLKANPGCVMTRIQ